jgi:hypothetical protein
MPPGAWARCPGSRYGRFSRPAAHEGGERFAGLAPGRRRVATAVEEAVTPREARRFFRNPASAVIPAEGTGRPEGPDADGGIVKVFFLCYYFLTASQIPPFRKDGR